MAARTKTKIVKTGPLFTGDPAKTLQQNIHVMMLAIAREGARDVRLQLREGEGSRAPIQALKPGHVSNHVFGELRRYPAGNPYVARILVRNRGYTKIEGTSLMAAASFVEGSVHAFRRTVGRIRRSREINVAELTKGLG